MFRGRYEHSIDAKGRTSVPSRFREVMMAQGESRLVLTTGLDTCLVAYPMTEWLAFEKRLSELPQFDADVVTGLGTTDDVDPSGEGGEFHTFVFEGPELRHTIAFTTGDELELEGYRVLDLVPDDQPVA